jgi:hypothetical protein
VQEEAQQRVEPDQQCSSSSWAGKQSPEGGCRRELVASIWAGKGFLNECDAD